MHTSAAQILRVRPGERLPPQGGVSGSMATARFRTWLTLAPRAVLYIVQCLVRLTRSHPESAQTPPHRSPLKSPTYYRASCGRSDRQNSDPAALQSSNDCAPVSGRGITAALSPKRAPREAPAPGPRPSLPCASLHATSAGSEFRPRRRRCLKMAARFRTRGPPPPPMIFAAVRSEERV